jgi:DNA polymerase II large subunit
MLSREPCEFFRKNVDDKFVRDLTWNIDGCWTYKGELVRKKEKAVEKPSNGAILVGSKKTKKDENAKRNQRQSG